MTQPVDLQRRTFEEFQPYLVGVTTFAVDLALLIVAAETCTKPCTRQVTQRQVLILGAPTIWIVCPSGGSQRWLTRVFFVCVLAGSHPYGLMLVLRVSRNSSRISISPYRFCQPFGAHGQRLLYIVSCHASLGISTMVFVVESLLAQRIVALRCWRQTLRVLSL